MGKLADRAAIKTASSSSFVYTPPDAAFNAARILVKPNLGYRAPNPATVSLPVLTAVLRGLRRASPRARILIVEGSTSPGSAYDLYAYHGLAELLDEETRLADAEELLLKDYPNLSPEPVKYDHMTAPTYIDEFDCRISIAPLKMTQLNGTPLISASLKNLYGLFPREKYHGRSPHARGQLHRPGVPQVLQDIYFSIGHYFDGAIVDLTALYNSPDWRPDRVRNVAQPVGKVIWGDDLLAVDAAACRAAGIPEPDYLAKIRTLRQQRG